MTERVTSGLMRPGAGDGFMAMLVRHRWAKGAETDRYHLRNTAPVLDPTSLAVDSQYLPCPPTEPSLLVNPVLWSDFYLSTFLGCNISSVYFLSERLVSAAFFFLGQPLSLTHPANYKNVFL